MRPHTLTHREFTDITGVKIALELVTLEINRAIALTSKLDGGDHDEPIKQIYEICRPFLAGRLPHRRIRKRIFVPLGITDRMLFVEGFAFGRKLFEDLKAKRTTKKR